MVFQVIWSRTALRQLREIKDYIAADNPTAADKAVHEIEERADLLQTMPFGFPAYAPRLDENSDTRSLADTGFSIESCRIRTKSEF
jgi:plasmid stabilization system protein ParE